MNTTKRQKELTQKAVHRIVELKEQAKHVESYDGFNIYETSTGKFFAVILFSGSKSKEFDTLLSLQNYYNL